MHSRVERKALYALQPALPQALRALAAAVHQSGLEGALIELVKIRASQINGCAFCLHMHLADARKLGERQDRLDVLSAWREAPGFTPRERAALAWTEALTLVAQAGVPDAVYEEASAAFSDAELANLTAAVVTINAWNRIAVSFGFTLDFVSV